MIRPSLSLLSFTLALAGCDMVGCGNKVLQVVVAPDGRHMAFVYRRDCGATTGFSTQVAVEPGARPLPDDPDPVLVLGDEPVFVSWQAPDRLLVTYRRGAGRTPSTRRERSMASGSPIGHSARLPQTLLNRALLEPRPCRSC